MVLTPFPVTVKVPPLKLERINVSVLESTVPEASFDPDATVVFAARVVPDVLKFKSVPISVTKLALNVVPAAMVDPDAIVVPLVRVVPETTVSVM